ncbi:peroxisomal biogenesis factor 11 [Gorgonomyces haynaldii]|nr:peroxisomal biogenesis factor 11 [Gorgonomyces haynaldii]
MTLFDRFLWRVMVFRKILQLNDGRDKILKVLQYTSKVLLWAYLKKGTLHDKSSKLASQLSITRKCIRLFHWLEPIQEIIDIAGDFSIDPKLTRHAQSVKLLQPLSAINGIVNDLSDDIICIGKIGLLDKQWVTKATPISDRCWFISIFLDVNEAVYGLRVAEEKLKLEKDPKKQKQIADKIYYQKVSLTKLMCDFIFCFIDVFQLGDKVNEGYQTVSGLCAALLGTYKLFLKNK